MCRLIAVLLFCAGIFCLAQSNAQVPMTGAGLGAAPASYIGPSNVVSGAVAWYSTARAYSSTAALAATLAVRVLDNTQGSNTYDLPVKSNGQIDLSQLVGITAHDFIIQILYDQTGHGNYLNVLGSSTFPHFALNTIGGFPVVGLVTASNSSGIKTTSFAGVAQPYSVSLIFKTPSGESFGALFADGAATGGATTRNTANNAYITANGNVSVLSASDNQAHSVNYRFNNPTDAKYTLDNGSITSVGITDTTAWGSAIQIGSGFSYIGEAGIWGSAISDSNLSALASNQATFYGAFPQ